MAGQASAILSDRDLKTTCRRNQTAVEAWKQQTGDHAMAEKEIKIGTDTSPCPYCKEYHRLWVEGEKDKTVSEVFLFVQFLGKKLRQIILTT